jgi:hypothetical protein
MQYIQHGRPGGDSALILRMGVMFSYHYSTLQILGCKAKRPQKVILRPLRPFRVGSQHLYSICPDLFSLMVSSESIGANLPHYMDSLLLALEQ